jgi:hypothetical protein
MPCKNNVWVRGLSAAFGVWVVLGGMVIAAGLRLSPQPGNSVPCSYEHVFVAG